MAIAEMPASRNSRRLTYAALVALILLPPLALFANSCGHIHGHACGLLQFFALLSVIPPLAISSFLAPDVAGDGPFWLAFVVVNFVVVTALAYLGIALWILMRKPRP